jgi:hypothetical protein
MWVKAMFRSDKIAAHSIIRTRPMRQAVIDPERIHLELWRHGMRIHGFDASSACRINNKIHMNFRLLRRQKDWSAGAEIQHHDAIK